MSLSFLGERLLFWTGGFFSSFGAMRKYPIGLQDFRSIQEGGFLYIDKTCLIHTLIESGKYYFLSRPRRFGKSLLLSTIKEIFGGSKELFRGLWIEHNWNWEQKHPVIHLKFSQMAYGERGLTEAISRELGMIAGDFNIYLKEDNNLKEKFRELIEKVAVIDKVVILIDEYDKPIIDYLDDLPRAKENRSIFKSFYSVLKDADEHIRLLLITGVSKFTKVSIFSDLNNLEDISMSETMNDLVGITQAELEKYFTEDLDRLAIKFKMDRPALIKRVKEWYNGYSWGGEHTLYNPFSILCFMKQGRFSNFWFQTGTPTFLVKQITRRKEFRFEGLRLGETVLDNFDIEHIDPAPLLFQTGYLTIKDYDPQMRTYELDYPNKEVASSLLDALLSAYREVYPGDSMALTGDLGAALLAGDIPGLIQHLNALISTIPYDHWKADSESIFHIIVHLTFKKLGVDIQSEVHSSVGRCDALIQTATHIYAIELKLNATAPKALDQILGKGYLQPYQADKRKKVAIGISFSSEDRKVNDYLVKEME